MTHGGQQGPQGWQQPGGQNPGSGWTPPQPTQPGPPPPGPWYGQQPPPGQSYPQGPQPWQAPPQRQPQNNAGGTKGLVALVILVLLVVGLIMQAFDGDDDAGAGDPGSGGGDVSVDFTMPDVTGLDLQSAQDLMQQNDVFFSTSTDLLGTRNQAVDSNWIVCTQSIPAGQQVTGNAEGQIDFGVVKRGEPCP
jgi:hypothetical protein